MKLTQAHPTARALAFTLIELLVVIAIIAMIVGLAVPSIQPMMKGSQLTSAADDFKFKMAAYRQKAIAENRPVQIRFIKYADLSMPSPKEGFRSYVAGNFEPKDPEAGDYQFVFKEIEKNQLPAGVLFTEKPEMSSMLSSPKLNKGTHAGPVNNQSELPFVSFTFRPDGSTDLPKRAGDIWFITLMTEQEDSMAKESPDNFLTIGIDSFTGAIATYSR